MVLYSDVIKFFHTPPSPEVFPFVFPFFPAKGAFLLTPSYELSIEKASVICEKMNFKNSFSLTKTATGILFKFENPEDYQAVFKKAFHKVTGARFYKKVRERERERWRIIFIYIKRYRYDFSLIYFRFRFPADHKKLLRYSFMKYPMRYLKKI